MQLGDENEPFILNFREPKEGDCQVEIGVRNCMHVGVEIRRDIK